MRLGFWNLITIFFDENFRGDVTRVNHIVPCFGRSIFRQPLSGGFKAVLKTLLA